MNPVATTGLLVAALRAEESKQPKPLFDDPFAASLAGDAGRAALVSYRAAVGSSIPIIEVRTRFFDEALSRAATDGIRQVVIVAAGMDARAYRLAGLAGCHVFELDQAEVLEYKQSVLRDIQPQANRRAVPADLSRDFSGALKAAGFQSSAPSVWLVEGLLQYLDESAVLALFEQVSALSAPGSRLLYDVVGRSLLEAPLLTHTLRMMHELGAPWLYGSDDPAQLASKHGWSVVVTDPAEIGNQWGRWPVPAAPLNVPGIPRGYLLEACNG